MPRLSLALILMPVFAAFAADDPRGLSEIATRVEQTAAAMPAPLSMEFRLMAAQALQARCPDLAKKLLDRTVNDLRAMKEVAAPPEIFNSLARLAPDELKNLLPRLAPGQRPSVIDALLRAEDVDGALALFAANPGVMRLGYACGLVRRFARVRPGEAVGLYRKAITSIPPDLSSPADAQALLECGKAVEPLDPALAKEAYEGVAAAASSPGYGKDAKATISGTFQVGSSPVSTNSARDTLLLETRILLRKTSEPATIKSFRLQEGGGPDPAIAAIQQQIGKMRGLPTDADRARLAIDVTKAIAALPPGPRKLGMAESIANLSTEGDLGKEALTRVASTLAEAIHQTSADADAYMQLASLIRYEHLPAQASDAGLTAAEAVLALRQQLIQENDFTLTALNGKTYSLSGLRGRVVLLNFWATWCPPCRKEMPDMEKLYREFENKGFTVLAVSDEERDTVSGFLEKQRYTFPILLDPGRKVHEAFGVEGIPKSFLFDREGKLVAQSIDMRTERQFLEMLRSAGLE